jgi:hypothetical protein
MQFQFALLRLGNFPMNCRATWLIGAGNLICFDLRCNSKCKRNSRSNNVWILFARPITCGNGNHWMTNAFVLFAKEFSVAGRLKSIAINAGITSYTVQPTDVPPTPRIGFTLDRGRSGKFAALIASIRHVHRPQLEE